jgi:peptidoglycan/xylan/chitin deacetylase (PgdA/CDA1 family)
MSGGLRRSVLAFVLRWLARCSGSRAGAVLVYHQVGGPDGDPELRVDPGVPTGEFERQLRQLRRHYRVVRADEVIRASRERRRGRRFPVAITFDDDLSSHVRHALPALRREALPATFFLCGASLHEPQTFWWEDLQRAIDDELVDANALPQLAEDDVRAALEQSPRAIRRVASSIERLEPTRRAEVAATLREAVGPPPPDAGLRSSSVRALADGGCDIGFHTLRHDALPALSDDALEQALHEGREEVEAVAGRASNLIAYPHGKADARVAEAARSAGYSFGFTTAVGLVRPDTDPHLIPRLVPPASASAFALHLARAFAGRL